MDTDSATAAEAAGPGLLLSGEGSTRASRCGRSSGALPSTEDGSGPHVSGGVVIAALLLPLAIYAGD
jgi:hypothetical protein